jgi:hypothetical protein
MHYIHGCDAAIFASAREHLDCGAAQAGTDCTAFWRTARRVDVLATSSWRPGAVGVSVVWVSGLVVR